MVELDGFRIDRVLAEDSHSAVYAAHDIDLNREVAVRVLPGRLDEKAFERLYDECRLPQMLSRHPNVVTVYDVVRAATGEGCVVAELWADGSLRQMLTARSLSEDEVAAIAVQIADALAVAHSLTPPLVHGALDTRVVLVADGGTTVGVTGFGLARFRQPSAASDPAHDVRALHTMFVGHHLPDAGSAAELRDELVRRGAPLPPRLRVTRGSRTFDWRSPEFVLPSLVAIAGLLALVAFAVFGSSPERDDPAIAATVPDDLVVLEDHGDRIVLAWSDPPGRDDLFVVEAPRDGLRRVLGPVDRDAERFAIDGVDPANGYCFWVVLPVEGEKEGEGEGEIRTQDDLVHISNPACIRGGEPDYP